MGIGMTTFKTTCADCGTVEIKADGLMLELGTSQIEGEYEFPCSSCGLTQRRPANEQVVAILLAAGVPYIVGAGAVTETDIADFAKSLDEWLQEITAA